jgi:hypothetical protein
VRVVDSVCVCMHAPSGDASHESARPMVGDDTEATEIVLGM